MKGWFTHLPKMWPGLESHKPSVSARSAICRSGIFISIHPDYGRRKAPWWLVKICSQHYLYCTSYKSLKYINRLVAMAWIASIRHLHISHNAPYLPPKILHNLCFSFLVGITVVPREIENNAYAKFWGQIRCIMGDVQEVFWLPKWRMLKVSYSKYQLRKYA